MSPPASRWAFAIASWFGCGLAPAAPGTVGSASAILLGVPLAYYFGAEGWWFVALTSAMTPLGVWAAGATARLKESKDPQQVVVDEVLGQWLALSAAGPLAWTTWIAAFALFRLFDVWKPFPLRRLERWEGGLGIVADDLGAGLYAALVLYVLRRAVAF
jgi:phosphatidylglycerophosphatase A